MPALRFKEDFDEARDRLTAWWNGEDIGRPAMHITVKRDEPIEKIPHMPEPEGWVTRYSTTNYDYRVYCSKTACIHNEYLAEAIPNTAPDLAPNCLALYLGCKGVEMPGTVWCEPCIESKDIARFELAPDNFYWDFTMRLGKKQLELGAGKFLVQFPDLIEGLDTLAAMRGTEELLMDLLDDPEWVHHALEQITPKYFDCYDRLYDMFKDDRGGSHFWAWAPGRMCKLQCDFSAMISADMFGEFMVPVLTQMTERLDYCMYHWDGPGAIKHHDHLLSIPRLNALQWTPGAGAEHVSHEKWWPLYHKTIDAGKAICLLNAPDMDTLERLRNELGHKLNRCLITMRCNSRQEADRAMALVSRSTVGVGV